MTTESESASERASRSHVGAGVRARWKREAAEHAAGFVSSGMVVGLGTGSTAIWAVRRLAQRFADGELTDIVTVSTSSVTEAEARQLGLPLTTLDAHPAIDLTIDGADEVDPALDLIKGGGGALLHEKIVAQATIREVIVIDAEKLSPALGTRFRVPVEVVPFGVRPTTEHLLGLGAARVELRRHDGRIFVSDEGNHILDAAFGVIADAPALAEAIADRAAVVEHGLFLGLASDVVIAGPAGIEHRRR